MIMRHAGRLQGELTVPGDKSISHRAVMLGSIARGTTEITHFLQGADCLSTIACFRKMGVLIEHQGDRVLIQGRGLHGLAEPDSVLQVGNSGTTARLISGILAPQHFTSHLDGDDSIRRRPMGRIITPLSLMGASIQSMGSNGCAPLVIHGTPLVGVRYTSPVASAQVKSSVLLAGLYAEGETSVTEPSLSRNHTELMLRYFGQAVRTEDCTVTVSQADTLTGRQVEVPGDISSAAYFIAAALLVPDSELVIRNVGINPTRDGMLRVCRDMGADITLENVRELGGEPAADLIVRHSALKGTSIGGSIIPALIDELPVLAVLACFAEGTTIIQDAQELKIKESNRIDVMVRNLTAMGADVEATDDGMIIRGGAPLHGAVIDSHLDHRIAMSFAVAALVCEGDLELLGADCTDISYPGFYEDLYRLITR